MMTQTDYDALCDRIDALDAQSDRLSAEAVAVLAAYRASLRADLDAHPCGPDEDPDITPVASGDMALLESYNAIMDRLQASINESVRLGDVADAEMYRRRQAAG